VLSSYAEGFGNVLVEAMGCGTPVIATNCEHGPAEILDDGRYGVLVEPRNAQALADAMTKVSEFPKKWPAPLLKSRASAFSTDSCVTAYHKLFECVVPRQSSRGQPGLTQSRAPVDPGFHPRSVC
jgi:glycosyltransferase involved in cell wall biosynthesis